MNTITMIDARFQREHFATSYLLQSDKRAAVVEVSTAHAVPDILKTIDNEGIPRENVDYIFVTHIHLDHASGAGALMKELPGATLVVHPKGAKHMIDPERLIEGAKAVFGAEAVEKDYGEIVPVPADRVIEAEDGQIFSLGNRKLEILHTPGHAWHHISVYDNDTRGVFTGDSMGLGYPEMKTEKGGFYQPTTSPAAFNYEAMVDSINKTMNKKPEVIYLTHYGPQENPEEVASQNLKRLNDYVKIAESTVQTGSQRVEELRHLFTEYYIKEAEKHGSKLTPSGITRLFDIDIDLNSQGLAIWMEKKLSS